MNLAVILPVGTELFSTNRQADGQRNRLNEAYSFFPQVCERV